MEYRMNHNKIENIILWEGKSAQILQTHTNTHTYTRKQTNNTHQNTLHSLNNNNSTLEILLGRFIFFFVASSISSDMSFIFSRIRYLLCMYIDVLYCVRACVRARVYEYKFTNINSYVHFAWSISQFKS